MFEEARNPRRIDPNETAFGVFRGRLSPSWNATVTVSATPHARARKNVTRHPPNGVKRLPITGAIAGTTPMIDAMRDNSRPAREPS